MGSRQRKTDPGCLIGFAPCVWVRIAVFLARQSGRVFRNNVIEERHRHRYEVNVAYREELRLPPRHSPVCPMDFCRKLSRTRPNLVRRCAISSELKSRPFAPHPLFRSFVEAAVTRLRRQDPVAVCGRRSSNLLRTLFWNDAQQRLLQIPCQTAPIICPSPL